MSKQEYKLTPDNKWMTAKEIGVKIQSLIDERPEYRNVYIFGMLTGLRDGHRTVEDVYDRIIKFFDEEK